MVAACGSHCLYEFTEVHSEWLLTNENGTSVPSLSVSTRLIASFSRDQPTTPPEMSGGYRYADEFRKDCESFPATVTFAQEVPIGAPHLRFHIRVSVP